MMMMTEVVYTFLITAALMGAGGRPRNRQLTRFGDLNAAAEALALNVLYNVSVSADARSRP